MKTYSGFTLIAVAFLVAVYNMADTIGDLHSWHDVGTPMIVMAVFKQWASVIMGTVGGTLLPAVGRNRNQKP